MTKDTILGGHLLQFVVYNDTDTSKDALNIAVSYTWGCLLDHLSAALIQNVEKKLFLFCFFAHTLLNLGSECVGFLCSFPLNKYVRLEFVFIKHSHN